MTTQFDVTRLGGYCAYGDKCHFLHPTGMQTTPEIDGSGSQSEIVRALWLKNYNAGGTNEGKTNGAPGRPDKGQAALTKAEWEQRAEIGRLRKAEKKARKAQIKAGLPVAPASMEVLTHQLSALKTDSTSD